MSKKVVIDSGKLIWDIISRLYDDDQLRLYSNFELHRALDSEINPKSKGLKVKELIDGKKQQLARKLSVIIGRNREEVEGENIFQKLYDNEVNFQVSCFYDMGFNVKLGDEANGFSDRIQCENWEEVDVQLMSMALKRYPEIM